MNTYKEKIYKIEKLADILKSHRERGEKLVLCHGCFDLMHPGHIKYFQAAAKMGDILIVTVTPDRFVEKGTGRPVFGEGLRSESIAALECVDYVAVNEWRMALETMTILRPHIYVKGQEFENLSDGTGKIQEEYKLATELGIDVRFTHEIVFSSTQLLNKHFLNG